MLVMATAGGMVTNHGWREAQREEIDSALRACVSAAAHFMRGDLTSESRNRADGRVRGPGLRRQSGEGRSTCHSQRRRTEDAIGRDQGHRASLEIHWLVAR